MSPKSVKFGPTEVEQAALELVRSSGWEALSARGIAARLGTSVAPVYSAFGSMEQLQDKLIATALTELDRCMRQPYTAGDFLNMGVGLAVFARDEPKLFLALYQGSRERGNVLETYRGSLMERLAGDPVFGQLAAPALNRLYERMWNYTVGLAVSVIYGHIADTSTGSIAADLREVGAVMIYAEFAGIAEPGSPAARAAWERLIAEKRFDPPAGKSAK